MSGSAVGGALSIRRVGKIYQPERAPLVALEDCSAEVGAGEFAAIVGPSGCGKSTLLNIIAGFDRLTSGEILLDGAALAHPRTNPVPGPNRVVVFQHGALFPWMTVLENVIYGPTRQRASTVAAAQDKAMEMLRRCGGLDAVADRFPARLSSGMQRRVEIVRALMNEPKVLLLDEPFRAMDTISKAAMHKHLLDVHALYPKTVFFITHDLEEAIYLADTVFVMTTRPGRIKRVLKISLPRPRRIDMLASHEYLELKRQVAEDVHEEARKSFERGERELA